MGTKFSRVFYIVTGVVLIGLLPLYFFFDPADTSNYFPSCPLRHTTGIQCAGCGSQRALHELLHLNIPRVFEYNALFLPAFALGAYHYLTLVFPGLKSKAYQRLLYHPKTPVAVLVVVLGYMLLRNLL